MHTTPQAPEGFKPFNDYFEYRMAGHFVSALINGDFSGLDNDEVVQALRERDDAEVCRIIEQEF